MGSGCVVAERAGLDADRQNVVSPYDEAAAIATASDPFYRPQGARHGHDFVADFQLLDSLLAALGVDQRAAAIAGHDIDGFRRRAEIVARAPTLHRPKRGARRVVAG